MLQLKFVQIVKKWTNRLFELIPEADVCENGQKW